MMAKKNYHKLLPELEKKVEKTFQMESSIN